jgi:hypothetical protein
MLGFVRPMMMLHKTASRAVTLNCHTTGTRDTKSNKKRPPVGGYLKEWSNLQ